MKGICGFLMPKEPFSCYDENWYVTSYAIVYLIIYCGTRLFYENFSTGYGLGNCNLRNIGKQCLRWIGISHMSTSPSPKQREESP